MAIFLLKVWKSAQNRGFLLIYSAVLMIHPILPQMLYNCYTIEVEWSRHDKIEKNTCLAFRCTFPYVKNHLRSISKRFFMLFTILEKSKFSNFHEFLKISKSKFKFYWFSQFFHVFVEKCNFKTPQKIFGKSYHYDMGI